MLGRLIKTLIVKPSVTIQKAESNPSEEEIELSRAYRVYQNGDRQEAENLLHLFSTAYPNNVDALCLLGEINHQQKLFQNAASYYRKAICIDPQFFPALSGLGLALYEIGDFEQAYNHLEEARRIRPKEARNLNYIGLVLMKMGNSNSARALLTQAVRYDPSLAEAWNNLGIVYRRLGDMSRAVPCFKRCVEADQDFSLGIMNYGLALRDCERVNEAEKMLRKAVKLRPGNATALLNLAVLLQDKAEFDEAHSLLSEVIQMRPESVEAHTTLGALLQKTGDFELARSSFQKALAIDPDYREAKSGLGELQLLLGDFETGWAGYEARMSGWDSPKRHFPYPEWGGESLEGKTILVYAEQGLGDIIMFASCLPDLIHRAQLCVIDCYPRLDKLIQRSFPSVTVHSGGRNDSQDWLRSLPKVDCYAAIGSLPRFFRQTRNAFPIHQGYLIPDASLVTEWEQKLSSLGSGLRVGIAWQGGLVRTGKYLRSLPLSDLTQLLHAPDVNWVSLQYTKSHTEIENFKSETGITLHHWQDAVDDLDQTAALISCLDLVISVCGTLVHLTGALGKPVWIMVPASPGWRYLAEGEALPWYPTARMFRQKSKGEWGEVLSNIQRALRTRIRK